MSWPENLLPKDVGLGPYDYPPVHRLNTVEWTFDGGKGHGQDTEGWYRLPYGTASIRVEDGALRFFRAYGPYSAIRTDVVPFEATRYTTFRFRMKLRVSDKALLPEYARNLEPKGSVRWGGAERPIVVSGGKAGDVRVRMEPCVAFEPIGDGEWHEYAVDMSASPEWTGKVSEVWFDPHNVIFTDVAIDWMRFE